MFLLRRNIKNINSFVRRGLYSLMLATYIRHIWVCSILITLSGDIEKDPGPKPSSCDKFSICHWNLSSISAHNFMKMFLLRAYASTHNFVILYFSETYLDSSISGSDNNLTIPGLTYISQLMSNNIISCCKSHSELCPLKSATPKLALREKCPNTELFLVRIFLYLDWTRRDTLPQSHCGDNREGTLFLW